MPRTAYQAYRSPDEPISLPTIISIGFAILACSILIAVIVVRFLDARKPGIALSDDEEVPEGEKTLPPYEMMPPAYVAELDVSPV